jgi:hypothetical protein
MDAVLLLARVRLGWLFGYYLGAAGATLGAAAPDCASSIPLLNLWPTQSPLLAGAYLSFIRCAPSGLLRAFDSFAGPDGPVSLSRKRIAQRRHNKARAI